MNTERLLQLATHLESGKLGHEKFDFSIYNNNYISPTCGTAGCAIGECPILWPKDWCFNETGRPRYRFTDWGTEGSAREWFNIDSSEFGHLFIPYEQDCDVFGGVDLTEIATATQVASNIRAFVAKLSPTLTNK